jgi:hypothetical protein
VQLDSLAVQLLLEKKGVTLHIFDQLFNISRWPLAKHRGECPEQLNAFILRFHGQYFGVNKKESYLIIKTTFRIPQLPGNLFQIGASVEQVMGVWMKDREYGGLLH